MGIENLKSTDIMSDVSKELTMPWIEESTKLASTTESAEITEVMGKKLLTQEQINDYLGNNKDSIASLNQHIEGIKYNDTAIRNEICNNILSIWENGLWQEDMCYLSRELELLQYTPKFQPSAETFNTIIDAIWNRFIDLCKPQNTTDMNLGVKPKTMELFKDITRVLNKIFWYSNPQKNDFKTLDEQSFTVSTHFKTSEYTNTVWKFQEINDFIKQPKSFKESTNPFHKMVEQNVPNQS